MNCSGGGALIAEVIEGLAAGQRLELAIPGIDLTITGTVRQVGPDRTHVKFDLAEDASHRLDAQLRRIAVPETPLAKSA